MFFLEIAAFVNDPAAHHEPSVSQLGRWEEDRVESVKRQLAHLDEKVAKEVMGNGRAMSEDAIRKRKEREEKRDNEKKARKAEDPEHPEHSATSLPSQPHTIIVPATSTSLEWYHPTRESTYLTVADARAARIWTFPETVSERAKCAVFRGLWEQGYFIGSGMKFGGDYLVYPGMYI
jgi:tRNA-splicing endonuclease subunit Sen34